MQAVGTHHSYEEEAEDQPALRVLPHPQEGPNPIYEITESCNSSTTSILFLTKTELHRTNI